MNIYSRIQPEKLLHIIVRREDIKPGRTDVVPPDQFLQCATLRYPKDKTFQAHRHLWRNGVENIPQESWIVIRGSVKVILYDIDGTILHEDIIQAGEASFTMEAAHNYLIMSDDTLVFEYKTGPYKGQEFDKVFINQ